MMKPLNPTEFTARVFSLVLESSPEGAIEWVNDFVNEGFLPAEHYRVQQAFGQIESARNQLERLDILASSKQGAGRVVKANVCDWKYEGKGIPTTLHQTLPDGVYENHNISIPAIDSFDPANLKSPSTKPFEDAGFFQAAGRESIDRLYVTSGVRLSATGWGDATLIDSNNNFHPTRSSRTARLTGTAFVDESSQSIPEALVLPFAFSPKNYYHFLSETAYGLRHAIRCSNAVPIVYDQDPFGVLPIICTWLSISPSRLVKRENLVNSTIEKAYLPDSGPYYWDNHFCSFFRSLGVRSVRRVRSSRSKVYISRRRSSRPVSGEDRLEEILSSNGFEILYAEDLSFEDQVSVFSNCDFIVAPHGAGLANSVFCPEGTVVVELFNSDFVNRDFQQRSMHFTPNYFAVLMGDEVDLNLQNLLEVIRSIS